MSDRQAIFSAMAGLLTGKQQLVVLALKRGSWSTLHKTGAGWDFSSGSPRLLVIKEAEAKREPVMILDSQLDDRMRAHRYSPFRSALCLPVVKPWGVAALVFAEEPERAQAFSHRQLGPWQELTDKLAETITAEPTQLELPVLTPKMLGGIAAALFGSMVLGWALKPAPPPPKAAPTISVPKPQEQKPEDVATGFLAAVNIGRYDVAYLLIKPELRKKLPQTAFDNQIKRWLAQPGVASQAASRHAEVDRVRPGKVTVALVANNPAVRPWLWVLVQDPEGWRLDALPGK
jgi:hypothetical protein